MKADFLNSNYSMSFAEWQEAMDEWVESAMSSDDPVEDFRREAVDMKNNYPNDYKQPGDKRTKEYKEWRKGRDTWQEIVYIAETGSTDDPDEVLDCKQTEIERLYRSEEYDRDIVEEATYKCATYYERACEILEQERSEEDDD